MRRQAGGADKYMIAKDGVPFEIGPENYKGIMKPYTYTIYEETIGLFTADFIGKSYVRKGDTDKGELDNTFVFLRVWASTSASGDPRLRIREAIKQYRLANKMKP